MKLRPWLVLPMLCATLDAVAQEQAAPSRLSGTPEILSGGYLLQVFASLAIVIGMLMGVLWLMRRFNGVSRKGGGKLHVLASVNLGQRERAVLIAAGEKQLLLGIGPGNVRTLHVFDEPIVTPETAPTTVTFKEVWRQTTGAQSKTP